MSQVIPIFASFLYHTRINDIDLYNLEKEAKALLIDKNQCDIDLEHNLAFKEIKEKIDIEINNICRDVYQLNRTLYELKINHMWISKTCNNITELHNHPYNYLSGVFYIKANPNNSKLVFRSGSNDVNEKFPENTRLLPEIVNERNLFNSHTIHIPSNSQDLILFPSWLLHMVKDNFNEDRISLAFDANLVKKIK